MTRIEAEERIMEKLKEIREIALEYAPEDQYLSLFFMDGHISITNEPRARKKLDCWMDVLKNDGVTRHDLEEDEDRFAGTSSGASATFPVRGEGNGGAGDAED